MFKKCITLITLTAFIIFIFACSSTKYLSLDSTSNYKWEKLKIQRAKKTTGEDVQFVNSSGRIIEDHVEGTAIVEKEIDREDIRRTIPIFGNKDYTHEMTTKDGKKYLLHNYLELDDQTALVKLDEEVAIPLSEVVEIEFKKRNRGKGALYSFGAGFLIGAPLGVLGALGSDSNQWYSLEGATLAAVIVGGFFGICLLPLGVIIGASDKHVLTAPADSTLQSVIEN